MAITYRTDTTLKIDNLFVDGDTRAITLKNPKDSISSAEITELNAFMQENNIIIGDKAEGTFGRITKVTRVTKTTLNIGLEVIEQE